MYNNNPFLCIFRVICMAAVNRSLFLQDTANISYNDSAYLVQNIANRTKQDEETSPADWSYLIPVMCVAGIGSACIPYFALGLAVGAVDFMVQIVISILFFSKESEEDREKTKEYSEMIQKNTLYATLWGPVIEEGLFRGVLQPGLMLAFILINPSLAVLPFLATGLSLAAAAAIACTSLIFGLLHLTSSKDNDDYRHAVMTTMGGVVLGVLAIQFGLLAAVAAHIIFNTLAVSLAMLGKSLGLDKEEQIEDVHQPEAEESMLQLV